MSNNEIIKAAGALLWRSSVTGYELAVIHRQRYDDWTLPKGKLEPGESWRDAALREVREETGYNAEILGFAGGIAYQTQDGPKVVQFWLMKAIGESGVELDREVAEVFWMTPALARARLQYPLEQALVEVWSVPMTELRKIFSMGPFRLRLRRIANRFRRLSRLRLETTLQILEAESEDSNANWNERSKRLRVTAQQSLDEGNFDNGWRYLNAADRLRLRLRTASKEECRAEAKSILAEARDESKQISKWRREHIKELLADSDGSLKPQVKADEVVRAKRTLDDHHNNVYHKLLILKSRLRLLTLVGVSAIGIWIVRPPLSPVVKSFALGDTDSPVPSGVLSTRWFWMAVILSGVLGAVFSGFSSSMSSDQQKTRIPTELFTSTVTFARLAVGMVSAVVVSIFLLSGVIDFPKPSLELLFVFAFVSGFSDRLLLRAIESVAK